MVGQKRKNHASVLPRYRFHYALHGDTQTKVRVLSVIELLIELIDFTIYPFQISQDSIGLWDCMAGVRTWTIGQANIDSFG